MLALLPLLTSRQLLPADAVAAPPAAKGSIGIRLLDIPRDAANDPRARAYIVDHVPPGTDFHRRIVVDNSTSVAQHVTLYAGGAAIVGDKFVPANPDELSSWIRVSPAELTLAPGAMHIATVSLSVPRRASSGERYATVWAQVKQPSSASHPVTLISRVGIRVYLDVGAGGDPPSDFRVGAVTATPGPHESTLVGATVTNTGQRAVDVSGAVSLTSADNTIHAGPYRSATVLTLLAGASGRSVMTVVAALPHGRWTATVTLTSGTITHTATGTITIGARSSLVPKAHSGHTLATALTIGGLVIGLGALGGGGYALRRKRRTAAS